MALSSSTITLALCALLASSAEARLSRIGEANVKFTATGPGGMKIVGQTSDLTIDDSPESITTKVVLTALSTGIELRDKHMRDTYLQVQSYPLAQLEVARSALKLADGDSSGDAPCTVSIHGKQKATTFHYAFKKDGAKLHVEGTVKIDMRDFGISVPSYLGVTVKPEVAVAVTFDAKESG